MMEDLAVTSGVPKLLSQDRTHNLWPMDFCVKAPA